MPIIVLPDKTKLNVRTGTAIADIAKRIGMGLFNAAIAANVDSEIVDLSTKIRKDCTLQILTYNSKEALEILKHSTSHVLAQAVKRLFPKAKLGIGPAIEEGFYYDFDVKQPFDQEDLKKIEEEMARIIKEDIPFERIELTKQKAKAMFKDEPYKLEMLEELSDISAYKCKEFVDLCKGPHVPSTGKIKAFKLIKTAGAYWKGDAKNPQLQRIYGISFPTKKELDDYVKMLAEAELRDHRKIGKEMDLFSFHVEAPGMPFFHPNGMIVLKEVMNYWREEHEKAGYKEIKTPIILRKHLWEQSGHWEHYKENMYFTKIEEQDYALKPMNCPGGILVYKDRLHSYRELPLRLAEFGLVHRHELSGVLAGLFRVRSFTQDDAHIYCTPEQVKDEIIKIIDLTERIYKRFGFEFEVELSTKPEKAMGSKELWDRAEGALMDALSAKRIKYRLNPGEGAFYGPKIDFHIKDCLGRKWQCGTIQLDFQMPEKFDITYESKDNQRKRIVMLHRTILGSLERFLGILVEHYAGKFPLWLAPEQVRILAVSEKFNKYAEQIYNKLKDAGLRTFFDDRIETVEAKIRDACLARIPYTILVGEKEQKSKSIAVRTRDNKVKFGVKLDGFIKDCIAEIRERV